MGLTITRRSALLFPAVAYARVGEVEQTDLFRQGENGVHTYRIPAFIETRKGTLLAVADARHDSDRDLPGRISLVVRRSRDRGRTWSAARTLRGVSEGGVGDASLLLDRKSGRIWCFHAYGPPGQGFATPLPNGLQVHAMHSDDDGVTWSVPVDLTPQLKSSGWQALFATSGTHFQTSAGRYLVPLVVRDAQGLVAARNAYSDDSGVTWRVSEVIGPDTDESKVVETADGSIFQNLRNGKRGGIPYRIVARSVDGVRFDGAAPDETLIDPSCNAGLARYRHGKHDLLLFTNAASGKRENLSIRFSKDSGRTWSPPKTLHAGPAAYSTVLGLRDGSIAVLYERGERYAAERITFARFRLEWLLRP